MTTIATYWKISAKAPDGYKPPSKTGGWHLGDFRYVWTGASPPMSRFVYKPKSAERLKALLEKEGLEVEVVAMRLVPLTPDELVAEDAPLGAQRLQTLGNARRGVARSREALAKVFSPNRKEENG